MPGDLRVATLEETLEYGQGGLKQRGLRAPMAGGAGWSFVRSISTNGSFAGTTGISLGYGASVGAGHVLINAAIYNSNVAATWTFSDSQGNAWTQLGAFNDPTVGVSMAVAFAIAGSTASDVPKWVNNQAGVVACDIFIAEFVPPAGTIVQDGSATFDSNSSDPHVTPAGGGTGSNDLVINLLGFAFNWSAWGGAWASVGTSVNGNACGYLINAAGNSTPNTPTGANPVCSMVVALQATGGPAVQTFPVFLPRRLGPRAVGPTFFAARQQAPVAPSPFQSAAMALGPALYWPMSESSGTAVADRSGNGRDGTITAGGFSTLNSSPLVRGDLQAGGYFQLGNQVSLVSGIRANSYKPYISGTQRTFSAWVYPSQNTPAWTVFAGSGVSGGTGNQPHPTFELFQSVAGQGWFDIARFYTTVNTFPVGFVDFPVFVPVNASVTGNATLLTLTYDDNTGLAELFQNGISVGVKGPAGDFGDHLQWDGIGLTSPRGGDPGLFEIGYRGNGASNESADGFIDEVLVYERILTPTEIVGLWNAGALVSTQAPVVAVTRGTGALSGPFLATAQLTGLAGATGSTSGSPTAPTGGGPAVISGSADAVGSATGSLTVLGQMAGTASAACSASGSLLATAQLAGSAAAAGGASITLQAVAEMSGSASAVGSTTGTPKATGQMAGTSAASSSLTLTAIVPVGTSCSMGAVATASIQLLAIAEMSGTAAAAGTASGTPKVQAVLAGSTSAVGTATATPLVQAVLSGSAGATSSATAIATVLGQMSGASSASSSLGGALLATAQMSGAATAGGNLLGQPVVPGIAPIAGVAGASSNLTGSPTAATQVVGSATSTGSCTGSLKVLGQMSGNAAGAGSATASAAFNAAISGTASATSSMTLSALVKANLAGSAGATSTSTGTLRVTSQLTGAAAANSGLSAAPVVPVRANVSLLGHGSMQSNATVPVTTLLVVAITEQVLGLNIDENMVGVDIEHTTTMLWCEETTTGLSTQHEVAEISLEEST